MSGADLPPPPEKGHPEAPKGPQRRGPDDPPLIHTEIFGQAPGQHHEDDILGTLRAMSPQDWLNAAFEDIARMHARSWMISWDRVLAKAYLAMAVHRLMPTAMPPALSPDLTKLIELALRQPQNPSPEGVGIPKTIAAGPETPK